MQQITVYPGTFDPITKGHENLIARAAKIFDTVIVGIAESSRKSPFFEIDERMEMATLVLSRHQNVEVKSFDGLLIDFVHHCKANSILRGLRAVSDFDYEFQLAGMNRQMAPDVETIFLPATEAYSYISSTMVREILSLGGNASQFVDASILARLQRVVEGDE
ncbi:MAG: pantetheine-phosphate adenylyltransferase [Gammaproteobacteria bacterium RIFCSPHIGHO2_12_FULL_41_15]|nr:MAG: pantetheine-phosphate adenylyltransferase [Gammaproteobacteria bacterium RIFCSPHIGHO2_12_FULL_41_15]